jgi:predicted dehydrogenase/threonine dehydrogenase-like Zn-dependent dehydrogenase
MRQVLIRQGRAVVDEIPAPAVEPGTILVQVVRSCISIGTELSGVRASGLPLWKRVLEQPQKVKQVDEMVATEGLAKARSAVEAKLYTGAPTGYSAAGIVLEAGDGVDDLRPGDRVGCAGAQCAYHAQVIRVPRNLTVPIPEQVGFEAASTVTLGAIALQAVRRATPTLGETFVVIGLGILGQLTAQLLRAHGCRVVGVDLDPSRVELALRLGMQAGLGAEVDAQARQVARLTDGFGADGVIVTAASPSDAILSTAFQMCRRKGRVVLVGDVGLHLNRADIYAKELDFLISTSYGPGRYDNNYEERGLDYPIAYVRWTENRNMLEYLRLVADGSIQLEPLISDVCPLDDAPAAYARLQAEGPKPMMVLLAYPESGAPISRKAIISREAVAACPGRIRLALIGAGGFARAAHLPNLAELRGMIELRAVVSRTGHNAVAAAKQFGAVYATTDAQEVFQDPEVDAVLVATRHDTHAEIVLAALAAGKHVLVEKPLALTREDLRRVEAAVAVPRDGGSPLLLTNYNRRFSPYAERIQRLLADRTNPIIINYRMNAGHIPLDHWVHSSEGGGRNRGEACHIYDLFTFLTGARAVAVQAASLRPSTRHYASSDNFVATVSFEDGSVATLTYTALGAPAHPKERMDLFVDGKVLVLDDYRRLTCAGAPSRPFATKRQDKGQRAVLERFAAAIAGGGAWPIPLWQQLQATEISLEVERFIA